MRLKHPRVLRLVLMCCQHRLQRLQRLQPLEWPHQQRLQPLEPQETLEVLERLCDHGLLKVQHQGPIPTAGALRGPAEAQK